MHPFIHVFGKEIPTYGVMMILAALAATLLCLVRRKRYHIARDDMLNTILYCIIGAIIGAKVLYVITMLPALIKAWGQIGNHFEVIVSLFSNSGLVFYGGFIGAAGFALWYLRRYKVSLANMTDLLTPAIGLAHAIGRVGCFMAGCCYGIECHSFGVTYTHSVGGPNGIPLLPVQLLESVSCLTICVTLLALERRAFYRGRGLALYMLLYAPVRFTLEFFRGDEVRGLVLGISTSQIISVLIFVIAVLLLVKSRLRSKTQKGT